MYLQTNPGKIALDSIDDFKPTNTILDLPVYLYLKNRKDHAANKDSKMITAQSEHRVFPLDLSKVQFNGALGLRASPHSYVELVLWPYMPHGVDNSDYVNVFDPKAYLTIKAAIENHTFEYYKGWKFEETCTFEFASFDRPTSIFEKRIYCAYFAQKLIRQIEGSSYLFGFNKPENAHVYKSYYEVDINPNGDYRPKSN